MNSSVYRTSHTPRGIEQASKKTGVTPRSVNTPIYSNNQRMTASRVNSTPTSALSSRLTSSKSNTYMVNRTQITSPQAPRKATGLSTLTPSRYGNDTPDAIARLDRELEPVPVDQKTQYSLFQRVKVKGKDNKIHSAMIQYVGRTKGSKKIMYGIYCQDHYKSEGDGTYYVCCFLF